MHEDPFEELWESAPRAVALFDPSRITHLPALVRRYLEHTLAPGAALSTAALVRMHGTLRVGGSWSAFEADQVLRWDRGFVWRARTRMKGIPIRGADRMIDGEAEMRWKALGIVPVVRASGPELHRAAAGRLHAECMWLPGVLLGDDVEWHERDRHHVHATVRAHGEPTELTLTLDSEGAIRATVLARWYTDQAPPAHYEPFGGTCGDDRRFGDVTLPSTYRLGWFYGTDRFESEGEFFRCTLSSVTYK